MRLLETTDGRTYNLTNDFIQKSETPPYAILSHTWEDGQEVTFDHLIEDKKSNYRKLRASLRMNPRSSKRGYNKLRFCASQANRDGLRYFWIDTCCINKNDPQELERAINSMFQWYKNAHKCYVYLSDVSVVRQTMNDPVATWQSSFSNSRWFTRGWTLQELLAPAAVEFFSREGICLGNRSELKNLIHDITQIPLEALSGTPLSEFGVDERLSWAAERETTHEEDEVYALLGIFDITLPFIYTEGYDTALRRLLDAIEEYQDTPDDQHDHGNQKLKTNIPFRRDKDFISCKSIATARCLFEKPIACVALVGLGGVGKSQIAIEYAYQVLEVSPETWIFWIHAESEARFASSYHEIAEIIKLDGRGDPKANIVQLVNTWLCNCASVPWLMIVDSADDASVFLDTVSASDMVRIPSESTTRLPHSTDLGSILVTSRSHEVARLLTGAEENIVEIGPMDDHDALALLEKKFNSTIESDEAMELIRALENMPLALTQAAAFINRTPRMSISRYMEALDNNRAEVLQEGKVDTRRDHQATNSITTTWQLSFDYIRKRSSAATRLLSLMSFFDRREIPRSLLENNYTASDDHRNSNFEDDIYMLTSFCLVKPNSSRMSFEMHGLVQHATRAWLERHGEILYWKETFITLMDKHYPVGHYENLAACTTLYPHAQAAIENVPQDEDALEAWASLCFKMAWYIADRANLDKAHKLMLDSYEVRAILWGEQSHLSLDSLNSLALIFHRLGRYEEAKEMYQKALAGQVNTLGAESKDALNTTINLGGLYNEELQWTEAEKLLVKALGISKSALGPEHSLTLNAKIQLASTYRGQSRWAEAVELETLLLENHESQLGREHPQTLAVKSNLAFTYRMQGRLKKAEQLQVQMLETLLAQPDLELETLALKSHLANTYRCQGRLSEAESLHFEVVQSSKAKLGPSHFKTLARMSHLSTIYCDQCRYQDALDLETQVLALRESSLGPEHLCTLDSKSIVAMTHCRQGRLSSAEALAREVFGAHTRKLGARHPLTLDSKAELALTLRAQGYLGEAAEMEEDVVRIKGEVLGPDHLETLAAIESLAETYGRQGRIAETIILFERCCRVYERVADKEHVSAVGCKAALAKWRAQQATYGS